MQRSSSPREPLNIKLRVLHEGEENYDESTRKNGEPETSPVHHLLNRATSRLCAIIVTDINILKCFPVHKHKSPSQTNYLFYIASFILYRK